MFVSHQVTSGHIIHLHFVCGLLISSPSLHFNLSPLWPSHPSPATCCPPGRSRSKASSQTWSWGLRLRRQPPISGDDNFGSKLIIQLSHFDGFLKITHYLNSCWWNYHLNYRQFGSIGFLLANHGKTTHLTPKCHWFLSIWVITMTRLGGIPHSQTIE